MCMRRAHLGEASLDTIFQIQCLCHHETPQVIHKHVCRPLSIPSIGGSWYFISFIDNYSRYTVTYMMKKKSGALKKLKLYVAIAETKSGHKVITCRSYRQQRWTCVRSVRHLSSRTRYTTRTCSSVKPQQNDPAKWMKRTKNVSSMIYHENMLLRF